MKTFSLEVSNYEVEELHHGDFLVLKLYAISNGVNNNDCEFMLESFEEGIKTIPNKPVLAYYNKTLNDVEEHNSKLNIDEFGEVFEDYQYETAERPVGVTPESSIIHIDEIDGKSWIVIENALIWTAYNKQLVKLLQKQGTKKVSVEVEILDSEEVDGVERFYSWNWLGITILGKYPDGMEVHEGIEGAHLELVDFSKSDKFRKFSQDFRKQYEKLNSDVILDTYGLKEKQNMSVDENKEVFLSKKEWGTGSAVTVDKSKESVSDSSWGDISKTELRNKVLKAKNYKSLVKSVYLLVEDGWEDSPASHLKYPVMEIKGDKAVYNAGGLLSAQQYGEKYDKSVARKAKRIRDKLGLAEKEKSEKMNKFIEFAKDEGYSYVGTFQDKLYFAKEEDSEVDKESFSLFSVEKSKCDDFNEDTFKAEDYWVESPMKLFEDDKSDDDEDKDDDKDDSDDDNKSDEEDKEKEAFRCEKEALKKELEDCKKELEACKGELETIRMKEVEKEAEEVMAADDDMDDKEKESLREEMKAGKFACLDDFIREVSYRKYSKVLESRKANKAKSATFAIHQSGSDGSKPKSTVSDLDSI